MKDSIISSIVSGSSVLSFDYGGVWYSLISFGVLLMIFQVVWWLSSGGNGGRPSYKFK